MLYLGIIKKGDDLMAIKIRTHNVDPTETTVWYLNEDKVAIGADVVEDHFNSGEWVIKFNGSKKIGYYSKAQAVADAKRILKRHHSM